MSLNLPPDICPYCVIPRMHNQGNRVQLSMYTAHSL